MADISKDNNEMRDEPSVDSEPVMNESSSMGHETISEKNEICVPDTVGSSEGGEVEKSYSPEDGYEDLNQRYVAESRQETCDPQYQRRYKRTGFTYPLEMKILTSQLTNTSFSGYIEDISIGGAGIKFEDRYGRIQFDSLKGQRVKLIVRMPHGDDIALLSTIIRIRRDINQKFIFKVGIEFEKLEDWQLKTVKQLISLKNKDQNMMWNLFENYEKNIR